MGNKEKKEASMMTKKGLFAAAILTVLLSALSAGILAAQDKYALKEPNGISFSEVRGYETWQVIAPSYRTEKKELRIILGNPVMIQAYKGGIPGNGKPFPEGSTIVKVGWSERKSAAFPAAIEPDVLQRVEFIVKDSKRFPDTNGWG